MRRIIALANHKGGTAKTTTTVNLAAALAGYGKKVLLIDMDPQANASSWLAAEGDGDIYAALVEDQPLQSQVHGTAVEGVSIVAGSRRLATAERLLAADLGAETVLRRQMDRGGADGFDYVLLDTPPALGLLTINALTAADEVLIPIEAHVLALSGVAQIVNTIGLVRERLNPRLEIAGMVLCRFDTRARHGAEVKERLVERFPGKVLDTVIRENIRLAEAPSFERPIASYAPRSTGAADYRALAAEIIAQPPREQQHGETHRAKA